MKVYKYTLDPGVSFLELPTGAKILSVQNQHERATLWALVPETASRDAIPICIVGTGHEIVAGAFPDFLGTVQFMDGRLVLHVFAKLPGRP